MKASFEIVGQTVWADLSKPIDLSIPLGQVSCFGATPYKSTPYISGDFVGAVREGSPVNFYDVQLSPHGHGTHTECIGHITRNQESIMTVLNRSHFVMQLISVPLTRAGDDQIVSHSSLESVLNGTDIPEALAIRTLPNSNSKLTSDYTGTNPPYLSLEAMQYLIDRGVQHLLVDMPSVDREQDEGKIVGHRLFWNVQEHQPIDDSRSHCTITELIYVHEEIKDGQYLLNLQVAPIDLDASPSRVMIYKIQDGQ